MSKLFKYDEVLILLNEVIENYSVVFDDGIVITDGENNYTTLSLASELLNILGYADAEDGLFNILEFVEGWYSIELIKFGKPILDLLSESTLSLGYRSWLVDYHSETYSIDKFTDVLNKFIGAYEPKAIEYFFNRWYNREVIRVTDLEFNK